MKPSQPDQLLSVRGLAEHIGVTEGTARNYRAAGRLPDPDFIVDNKPLWRPATIDAWAATRPRKPSIVTITNKYEEGCLSPYRMVPDPDPSRHFTDAGDFDAEAYDQARARAHTERHELMLSTLSSWIPLANPRKNPGAPTLDVEPLLRAAIETVEQEARDAGRHDSQINPRRIIEALRAQADPGSQPLADMLDTAAKSPHGRLIIPQHTDWLDEA